MSMAEWVSSEMISGEVGLVLLLAMIHYSTVSLSYSFFLPHSDQPMCSYSYPVTEPIPTDMALVRIICEGAADSQH